MKNKKDYVCPELTSIELYLEDVMFASPGAEEDPFGEGNPWQVGGGI